MIYEYDAPPRAYFEVTDGTARIRVVAKAFHFPTEETMRGFLTRVREYLSAKYPEEDILWWWRRLPVKGDHHWSCRFATSPPLDDEWLAKSLSQALYDPNTWEAIT